MKFKFNKFTFVKCMLILLIVLLSTSKDMTAQGLFIGADAAVNYTSLLNKNDREADNSLNYMTSIAPKADLRVGYRFKSKHAITLGISYLNVVQRYEGSNSGVQRAWLRSLTAKTDLDYIKIPLTVEFCLAKQKKIRPLLSAGIFYAHLLNYTDKMEGLSVYSNRVGEPYDIKYEVHNYEYDSEILMGRYKGTSDRFFYSKTNFGVQAGAGIQATISSRINFSCKLNASYSLNDVENKRNPIDKNFGAFPWSDMSPKYYTYDYGTGIGKNRPATRFLVVGLNVGIDYTL